MGVNALTPSKKCSVCGKTKPRSEFGTRRQEGRAYSDSTCRACKRSGTRRYRNKNPSARLLQSCKNRARRQKLPFDLNEQDLANPKQCPVLGIPLAPDYTKRTDNTPSVDRIVPEKGYVRGNVAVVSWRANRLKNDASLSELRAIAGFYSTAETAGTYPWCLSPSKCAALGYCPRKPNCGD
jgi:hypothetical protein